jgi:hypothetical protein
MKISNKLKIVLLCIVLFFVIGFTSDFVRDFSKGDKTQRKFWGKKDTNTPCFQNSTIHCVSYYVCWVEVYNNGCPAEYCK